MNLDGLGSDDSDDVADMKNVELSVAEVDIEDRHKVLIRQVKQKVGSVANSGEAAAQTVSLT